MELAVSGFVFDASSQIVASVLASFRQSRWWQQTKLPHHSDVVARGSMFDDLAIANLIPVNVLNLEMLLRRLDAYQHPAVHWKFSDAAMRAADLEECDH